MLKPSIVQDGRSTHIPHVKHRAEVQTLALYDPHGRHAAGGAAGGAAAGSDGSDDDVRLASVDATGRALVTTLGRDWMSDADMASYAASSSSRQYALDPYEPGGAGSSMPGWAGVCFNHAAPDTVAVARHFAKSIDVFDGDRRVRTMNTLLNPYSIAFVPTNNSAGTSGGGGGSGNGGGSGGGGGGGGGGDGKGKDGGEGFGGLLAVSEGNQLSLWDVRQSERGGSAVQAERSCPIACKHPVSSTTGPIK
jgi:hypothetical protein